MRPSLRTSHALAATAPTEGAAYSQPKPAGPTCRMSAAKMGSNAVADEKKQALKSSSMLERINGEAYTKRRPSTAELHVTGGRVAASRTGRSRIAVSARITPRNDKALKA